jgi:hypothetical protein
VLARAEHRRVVASPQRRHCHRFLLKGETPMPELSLPDPRLRKALEQIDLMKKELRSERVRSGNLRHQLDKLQAADLAQGLYFGSVLADP